MESDGEESAASENEDILPAFKSIKEQKASEFMTGSELAQCAICLAEIGTDEFVRPLPCKHVFHNDCISLWLQNHLTCPICRAKFRTIDGKMKIIKPSKSSIESDEGSA
ncbi:hypothetical protein niasHT_032118 [Heterodera trifolii]|uniref:RING-type domain-containing protein n=1 Tax=Heterodera trifolii TaxID=157864 RepID=A0ABD2HTI8_9BILA